MNSLSYELIAQIASYLTAGDAISWAATCRRVRAASLSRLDPERYLQPTFKHARYLLGAMTDYGCILSGSRALEYFVPGSIDDPDPAEAGYRLDAVAPSDWDFLVPCFKPSVYGMMYALSRCGVQWQNPLSDLFALVHKPAGSFLLVKTEGLYCVYPSQVAQDSMKPPSEEALNLFRQLHSYVFVHTEVAEKAWVLVEVLPGPQRTYSFEKIRTSNMTGRGFNPHTGRLLELDPTSNNGAGTYGTYGYQSEDLPLFLINGYITPHGGLRQKVQLFQCHTADRKGCTPLEYVVNTYYATHVQCFISGWSAGHFYYDLARQKLALAWDTPTDRRMNALEKGVKKYRRRGFRFFRADPSELAYRLKRYEEYDDKLLGTMHHDTNPQFIKAVYTPEHLLPADPAEDAQISKMSHGFRNAHFRPRARGPGVQEAQPRRVRQKKQPAGTPAPLTTLRTGRLSQQGYDDLLQYGRHSSNSRLGNKGTLLIRFKRLQDDMYDMSRSNFESSRAASGLRSHYANLEASLCKFRFLTMTRPDAIEPVNLRLLRLNAVDAGGESVEDLPSLCEAIAFANAHNDENLGNHGAPPKTPTKRFDRSFKEWKYYQLLTMLTATACFGRACYHDIAGMFPPQI